MGGIINAIGISSQGLSAQRAKMNVIAQNMANAETVETPEGGPYRRKQVVFSEDKNSSTTFSSALSNANTRLSRTNSGHRSGGTVRTGERSIVSAVSHKEVVDPNAEPKLIYDPEHPDANEDGYVEMPNVEIMNEMVDLMTASRAYEANTTVISSAKSMAEKALEI